MAKKVAPKRTLRFSRSGGSIWSVQVNGKAVAFAKNTGKKDVTPGDHAVQWFVQGPSNSTYTFETTAPAEAKFKHDGTLDNQGRDQGSAWVVVN